MGSIVVPFLGITFEFCRILNTSHKKELLLLLLLLLGSLWVGLRFRLAWFMLPTSGFEGSAVGLLGV